ncbi:MAG: isoprenylcysteine carboxylmethyltransferase family protein [Nannocystaceae bacterium]
MGASRELLPAVVARLGAAALVLGAFIFAPAGTLRFWPGWLYLLCLLGPMAAMTVYLLRRDPELLRRRMKMQEKRAAQGRLIKAFGLLYYAAFLLPGFDHRFGWSEVPAAVIVAADLALLAGYALFAWVLKTNSYAARTIEVEAGQRVITSGPYAFVRHPMYTAVIVMMTATPLALASYWATIPFLFLPLFLALRVRDEEAMLRGELAGYRAYCAKVRWRLVPGLW